MARIGRVPASGDRGDDRALVMAAQAGDRGALDRLLHRHQDRIYAVCRRLAGNDADGLDAAQEALIAIVRGLPRFDRRSRFATWAYRVATNAALDELRRRRRRPEPGLDGIDNGPGSRAGDRSEPELAQAVADRIDLDSALAGLPDEFRAPVVLRDVAGFDYAGIAEVLDLAPGTVRSRIARGRARLAEILNPEPRNHRHPDQRPTDEP